MPFILKTFDSSKAHGKKIQNFLHFDLHFSLRDSQRLVNKWRVFDDQNKHFNISQKIKCDTISVAVFEGITKGLKPIFITNDFAFFDKPSGLIVHPTSRNTAYSLLDEIRYHFGEDANLAHRIDLETSGLVMITRNKYSDMVLKEMFENKEYHKEYLAIVQGKLSKEQTIHAPLSKDPDSLIRVKMKVMSEGKTSTTIVKPLQYDPVKNQTLVQASPLTGRQHQIRVHLDYIGHTIIGDPLYGVEEIYADMYLNKELPHEKRVELTHADRLMLHSNKLQFKYENIQYKIQSKLSLI